jgi:hypothetical protein
MAAESEPTRLRPSDDQVILLATHRYEEEVRDGIHQQGKDDRGRPRGGLERAARFGALCMSAWYRALL